MFSALGALIFLAPVYVIGTGHSLLRTHAYDSATNIVFIALTCISYFAQTRLLFMLIGLLEPLQYSICDIARRAVQIVTVTLITGHPINIWNAVGITTTMIGVFMYNYSTKVQNQHKDKRAHDS